MKNIYTYLVITLIFTSCSKSLQIYTLNKEIEPYYEIKFINNSLNPYEIYLPEGTFKNDMWIIDGKEKKAPFVIEYGVNKKDQPIDLTTSHDNFTYEVINYSDSFNIEAISKKKIKLYILNLDTKPDSIFVKMISRNNRDSLENITFYIN